MNAFTVGESRGIGGVPTTDYATLCAAEPITSFTFRIPDRNGRPLVTIHPDGRVELGEGYGPDEAARSFWDAVQCLAQDSLGQPRNAGVPRPGKDEVTLEELAARLGGELPSTLPLEGWRTMTLHCQVDAIGPSDRHQDLVAVGVAFPPVTEPPKPSPCTECLGSGVVPNTMAPWVPSPSPVLCPSCSACTATALHALAGIVHCSLEPGHYDESKSPNAAAGNDPGGWHQSLLDRSGFQLVWCDTYDCATPHGLR
ncbi:hypothetical protein ACFQ6U_13890 [Streptomyces sp. NPDC056465]|uniref:hypothetical protein n=1 Tax=Streptomyces sp. NPDC056465 TaxID=3345829 RepID=UPI0036AA9F84